MIDSSVDVAKDITDIKNGHAIIKGDLITVNGRTYLREANGTLAPISGKGFTTLDRGEFKILAVYKTFGNTKQANQILNNMRASEEAKLKAFEVWKRNKK
ncbi:hypothetical protein A9G35_08880 [Gilliamella sp. Choc5-1]|nr:hypothetical protein A9G35_08880 [Gilliamella apicola]